MAKPDPNDPPKVLNHDRMKALLEAAGWKKTVGGKHSTKMTKPGERPITIPRHSGKDFGPMLRNAILTQAGLRNQGLNDDTGTDDRGGDRNG